MSSQMVLFALILLTQASKANKKVLKYVIWADYQSCELSKAFQFSEDSWVCT